VVDVAPSLVVVAPGRVVVGEDVDDGLAVVVVIGGPVVVVAGCVVVVVGSGSGGIGVKSTLQPPLRTS